MNKLRQRRSKRLRAGSVLRTENTSTQNRRRYNWVLELTVIWRRWSAFCWRSGWGSLCRWSESFCYVHHCGSTTSSTTCSRTSCPFPCSPSCSPVSCPPLQASSDSRRWLPPRSRPPRSSCPARLAGWAAAATRTPLLRHSRCPSPGWSPVGRSWAGFCTASTWSRPPPRPGGWPASGRGGPAGACATGRTGRRTPGCWRPPWSWPPPEPSGTPSPGGGRTTRLVCCRHRHHHHHQCLRLRRRHCSLYCFCCDGGCHFRCWHFLLSPIQERRNLFR